MLKHAETVGIENVLIKPINPSLLFDATVGALRSQVAESRQLGSPAARVDDRLGAVKAPASCWWKTRHQPARGQ